LARVPISSLRWHWLRGTNPDPSTPVRQWLVFARTPCDPSHPYPVWGETWCCRSREAHHSPPPSPEPGLLHTPPAPRGWTFLATDFPPPTPAQLPPPLPLSLWSGPVPTQPHPLPPAALPPRAGENSGPVYSTPLKPADTTGILLFVPHEIFPGHHPRISLQFYPFLPLLWKKVGPPFGTVFRVCVQPVMSGASSAKSHTSRALARACSNSPQRDSSRPCHHAVEAPSASTLVAFQFASQHKPLLFPNAKSLFSSEAPLTLGDVQFFCSRFGLSFWLGRSLTCSLSLKDSPNLPSVHEVTAAERSNVSRFDLKSSPPSQISILPNGPGASAPPFTSSLLVVSNICSSPRSRLSLSSEGALVHF